MPSRFRRIYQIEDDCPRGSRMTSAARPTERRRFMTSLPLLIGVLAGCGLVGAVPALVNALKPRLQERLHLEPGRVERLERMQFFLAWVAGMPLAGYLADAWSRPDVLVVGCVGIAI